MKEVENLEARSEPKERVIEEEVEGEIDEPEKKRPTKGEFMLSPGKEPIVEEATKHPLPAPYPQRLKKDKQETQS